MRSILFLIISCLALAAADAPATNRLWLTYGDYMFGFQCLPDMTQSLLTAADPKAPPIARLGLGIGAHGSTVEIWKSGAHAWITGEGKVATTNWRDNNGGAKAAAPFEGRKADLVLVQLDLSYVTGREAEKMKAETDTAVASYVAAAKKAGAKLVFYVLPGSQHTTQKRGKTKDGPMEPKTEADFQLQLAAMEAEATRLEKTHGVVLAPTFRAFAALRKANPGMDLHAPTRGDDTHLSPKDGVLCAMVINRAYLGETFVPPATSEALLAIQNKQIATENAKRKIKGEPEQELSTLDETTWKAMLAATTAAFTAP